MLKNIWSKGNTPLQVSVWKSIGLFLRKLGINLPQDPEIPLLSTYPAQAYHKDICSTMFIAVLFVISRTWKQPRCPSTEEGIKKMWCIYIKEYYSVVKINNTIKFVGKWMEIEKKTLSEVIQIQKDNYGMYLLISIY